MRPLVLGLDFGTSGVKAAAYDEFGAVAARSEAGYPTHAAAGGVVEQAPADWWSAAARVIRAVAEAARPRGAVRAIGLSGQIGTIVPIGRDGVPVPARVPTWQDLRPAAVMERIDRDLSRERRQALLGIDLPPGPNWPLPRLLWWRAADPECWVRTRWILQSKDYIGLKLTGSVRSDPSSWRGLVHLPDGAAVPEVLAYLGLSEEAVPPRSDPGGSRGQILPELAESLGIDPEAEVAVGWNDLNAAALGAGLEVGEGFDIAGTSDHLGVVMAAPAAGVDGRLTAAPFRPGTELVYGVTSMSGGALDWLRDALIAEDSAGPPWVEFLRRAGTVPAGAEGLLFLPHLAGERAPLWDPKARGAFIGVTRLHRREHFVRAVMEGVAFHLESIREILPASAKPAYLKATGGPTRLALWNQIRADVFGLPLLVAEDPDLGARGAAVLAAPLAGMDPSRLGLRWTAVEPDPERHRRYRAQFRVFGEAYPRLKSLVYALGEMSGTVR